MILTLSMLLAICPLGALNAFAETTSGTCGDNVAWSLDTSTGVLTISGEGNMYNYSSASNIPWYTHEDSILYVVIDDGVTSIGEYSFYGLSKLSLSIIPDSVTEIGSYAF